MSDERLDRLINDEPTRVVVIGGGMGGLVAARDLARPGFEVTVLEASDRLGGAVARLDLDLSDGTQLTVDAGAESYATRGGHVVRYLTELHLGDQLATPNPAGAWLQLPGKAVPTPKGGMLGIPSSPLARDVVAAIGWPGALRAYLDRVLPPLKIGQEHNLGRLVERRMGRAVLENLVAPVATGVYSAPPEQLDVAVVAPGLNPALTRTGSLSGAVAELRAGGPSQAGSAVGGVVGGMWRLAYTVAMDAARRGAELRTGARAIGLARTESGFLVRLAGQDEPIAADVVLVDVPSDEALPLLAGASSELQALAQGDWPPATSVELVTLVVDAPALDAAPRGTGVLVSDRVDPEFVTAKAMTHLSAKWPWVAERLPAGRHVLRLSYGRAGGHDPAGSSDAELRARALRDASALMNMPLVESMLLGDARVRWRNAQPLAASGQRARLDALLSAVAAVPGLEVTGSWIAGTGLASVIPHAREAGARLRGLRWRKLTDI